jgi:pimeloyl-ACP methyl ester carboxylesterase
MDSSYFFPYMLPLTDYYSLVSYNQSTSITCTADLVDELAEVLIHARATYQSVTLFAHSFGSALLMQAFGEIDGLFDRLILCSWIYDGNCFNYLRENTHDPDVLRSCERDVKKIASGLSADDYYREVCLCWTPLYFTPSSQMSGRAVLGKIQYSAAVQSIVWKDFLTDFDGLSLFESIKAPILSLRGQNDGVVLQGYIERAILAHPNAFHHVEITNAGHFPFVEQPLLLYEAIRRFIDHT